MLRISKLADYSTVIMSFLAEHYDSHSAFSVNQIAQELQLGQPTVSKILKCLAQAQLLNAKRGARGGYSLSRPPTEITLAQVISVMEGNPTLTECGDGDHVCAQDGVCEIKTNWQLISKLILKTLDGITLAEMNRPLCPQTLMSKLNGQTEQTIAFISKR